MLAIVCFPALWMRRKDFGLSSSFLRTGREKEGGEKESRVKLLPICVVFNV